jgi:hypothetical protein
MLNFDRERLKLSKCCALAALAFVLVMPAMAIVQEQEAQGRESDRQALLNQIETLEKRLSELKARAQQPDAPPAKTVASAQSQQMPQMGQASSSPPAQPQSAGSSAQGSAEQTLRQRIEELERRVGELESSTVLSEPETRVRRVEVYVDANGVEYDHPVPGARRVVTYQRERVFRRQTINEKIEEALSAEAESRVQVGVDAAIAPQGVVQVEGPDTEANGRVYQLASADLFFTARIAQYTLFFADVVGLTGPPPDSELPALTLINGYTARLVRQNELNVREAWVRTELFGQRLAINAGRLDLTNYFDRNAGANDETSQFISDALVNNPTLGLSTNGAGVAMIFDPKRSVNFKIGFQQSNTDATSLSDSIFSLAEIGYLATPFSLGEGNYRIWGRMDNSTGRNRTAFGISLDQKLAPMVTLFGRYGYGQIPDDAGDAPASIGHHFYSGGLQFQSGLVINPSDTWGIGYAQAELARGGKEKLVEGYYNFGLTERLRLSFHLQYFKEWGIAERPVAYLVPGVRLQASF